MSWELPDALIERSNSLSDTGAWIWLFELQLPAPTGTLRFANNTEDITWNGETWNKCYFQIDDIPESDNTEVPQLNVRLPNPDNTIQAAVESIQGGVGNPCILYLIHSNNTSETTVINYSFKITGCKIDSTWATFTLGGAHPYDKRVPQYRLIKNYCPFRFANETEGLCGYDAEEGETCNKTLAACRAKGNAHRFGGTPGVGSGKGFYA